LDEPAKPPFAVPVLETRRLRLRPLRGDDAEALHEAYADPQVMHQWSLPPSADLSETRERLAWSLKADPQAHAGWALVQPATDRLIGLINYHHREARHRRLEIGYLLARAHWGQGLMREAMAAVLDHCFGSFSVHRVEAMVAPDNMASRQLLQSLGFVCESEALRDRLKVGDSYRTMTMYGLLAPDWWTKAAALTAPGTTREETA
jgi:ribosomal-protein-alanine N-acetyltransferase